VRVRLIVTMVVAAGAVAAVGLVSQSDAASMSSSRAVTIPLLRVALDTPVTVLDQGAQAGGEGPSIESLAVEQLMKFSQTGQVEPNLARSVSQPSQSVYVYHLRHGVKFSDGNEMTSLDVANALNYYRHPGSQLATYYANVKAVRATDKYTVSVTLKHPDASWPPVTAFAAMIFEKTFQDAHKTSLGKPGTLIIGTGPWVIDSLDPTSGIELSANPSYRGGPPNIRHISVKFITTSTQEALAFRAGQIDFVPYVGDPRGFVSASHARLISVPSCTQGLIGMNYHTAPWSDIHVRRAVAYATNRADVIAATGAAATPISTLIAPLQLRSLASPSQISALVRSLPSYPFDLAKAKQEMAKSAYPNGFTADFPTTDYGNVPVIQQAIAGDLAKIGIKLKIHDLGTSAWLKIYFGPRSKIGAWYTTSGCLPDPSFFPNLFLGSKNARPGAQNFADYDPPGVDRLLAAGVSTTNRAKRFAAYSQLLRRLALDLPYLSLFAQRDNMALSPRFTWPSANDFALNGTWALGIRAS
jgi:peptide/nickel transport system substrate-binding protein